MSFLTIKWGDTLSGLASRLGTSVESLMNKNPQIKDPNLIIAGAQLNTGGGTGAPGSNGASAFSAGAQANYGSQLGSSSISSLPGGQSAPFDIARSLLGQNISSLKYSGALSDVLDKWPGNNVCCANFVSACLQKAGLISNGEHNDSVSGLANNLSSDPNFHQVDLQHAKPGDVVCFNVPGEGPYSHVEMFAGWQNGQPLFIGSNNVNADGSQAISMGPAGYPIAAIFQHS